MNVENGEQLFPTQRRADWVISSVGDDTLVYDRATNELHTLKAHHVAVWEACTGHNSANEIARLVHLDAGAVEHCLAHLSTAGLLDSRMQGVSRRKILGTAGVLAGIVSISAPMAAMASSTACACGPVDCNIPVCDEPGGCYYLSNPAAAGQSCNGGRGTCDTLGNCIAGCTCRPVDCNTAVQCFPTYCIYTPNIDDAGKPCNGGVGICDAAGNCN